MFENPTVDAMGQKEKEVNELLIALKDAPIEKLSSTPAFLDAVGDIVEGQ